MRKHRNPTPHGTMNAYTNYRCRCHRCKAAQHEYMLRYKNPCPRCGKLIYNLGRPNALCRGCRTAEITTPLEEQHGTTTGYAKGCRCDECREASNTARRDYRARHPEAREREAQARMKRHYAQKAKGRF